MTPRPVFASDSESDEDVIRPSAKKKLTAGKKVLVRADALGSSNSDAEEEEVAAAKPNEDEEQADNVGDVDKSGSEDNKDDEDKEDDKDDKEGDGQEGEDEDEDKDDEVFTVEAIMDHRFGGKNNKVSNEEKNVHRTRGFAFTLLTSVLASVGDIFSRQVGKLSQ
jgi:hypothetical protein